MNSGMTRWNLLPWWPKPFSPVQSARKFSAVLGTTSSKSSKLMRPERSLISLSVLVTLPEASTVAWGPSQVQSKKTFMTMLADDAWKERAKVGWLKDLLRSEAVMEGLLDRNRAAVDVEREENILLAEEGQFHERGAAALMGYQTRLA